MLLIVQKALVELILSPQTPINAATYRFRDIRFFRGPTFWILGIPPKGGGALCPGPICTIMQNFTPIGVTVAEISVTEHIERITANLISDK